MNSEPQLPWYKEPFVWLIISLPASAIVAGFYTLYLAIVSYDGLVVDDYYKQGLTINKRIEKENNAKRYSLEPVIKLSANNTIQIDLKANHEFTYPNSIDAVLSHATKQGFDQAITLQQVGPVLYQANINELVNGHWNVIISQDNWRINKSLYHY